MSRQYDVQRFLDDLHTKLPGIAMAFKNSAFEVKGVTRLAKTDLEELCEKDEIKKLTEVKNSYEYLCYTIDAAYEYLDKVDDLFWKLSNKTGDVIKDLENGKSNSIIQLYVSVKTTINDCQVKYALFLERSREFVRSCDRAERECNRLQEEAETKKTVAKAVGGTGAAAVAVGGTVASVLVGVFTFGVGFAVGLPLTVAGTVAATGAATGATVLVAYHYGKAAESFREISRKFKSLQHDMSTVEDKITSIHQFATNQSEIKVMSYTERIAITRFVKVIVEQSKVFYRETTDGLKQVSEAKISYSRQVRQTFVYYF